MNEARDQCSGLHGPAYGLAQLERVLAQSKQQGTSGVVLLTDFDYYARWNYNHGHNYGDVMLRQLAAVVEGVVGDSGTVARVGADEFLVVLPSMSLAPAKGIAEQINAQAARQKVHVEGRDVPAVTMTIAIILYPAPGQDAESLWRTADEAILQSKENGQRGAIVLACNSPSPKL